MSYGRTVRRFSVNRFKSGLHYHGCGRCRGRYSCSCDMPGMDMNCSNCNGGHPVGYGYQFQSWAPRECCREHTRQANDHDRETYKLAGPGPWFICTHCWRQQPVDPRRTNV